MRFRTRLGSRIACGLLAAAVTAASAAEFEINLGLDSAEAPNFSAKGIAATVGGKTFRLSVAELTLVGRTFRDVKVTCGAFSFGEKRIECRDGVLQSGGDRMPVDFTWDAPAQALQMTVVPRPGETWRLLTHAAGEARWTEGTVENGSLAGLAGWIPGGLPRTSAGSFSGKFTIVSAGEQIVTGELALKGAAFADQSGQHAGEKLDGALTVSARSAGDAWRWGATLEWKGGEVFWQPVYARAIGQTLRAEGVLDAKRIAIERATLTLPGVGELHASGLDWDRVAGRVINANVSSSRLDAAALYREVLQPHLAGTVLSELRVAGGLSVNDLRMRNGELDAVDVALHDLSVDDAHRRFSIAGANGRVPWHRSEETRLDVSLKGGEALRIPFGPVRLPVAMRGMRFRLEQVEIPVLDGTLVMRGFASDPPGEEDWRWAFRGTVTPISMEAFTKAIGWPTMHGSVSAEIPRVGYSRSTLRVGGALVFKVFDGTVEARNIELIEPFGKAPRFHADLEMKGLDLDLFTRTFSFGSIQGRVDAEVKGLELSNWRPVRFDIRVRSSAGEYPRKISQKAVENITALGGATAAAAIQRMFLRFFEQFDYEKLGWSCRLEKGVCRMGGVEDTPKGYVIVKGSGIPALSVLGYNRNVDWQVLVERVRRIMQDNVRAVVE